MKYAKQLSVILSICLTLALFPVISFAAGWDGTTKTEPQKDENGAYVITCAQELAWFSASASSDSNAVLSEDIDLAENEWTPISPSAFQKYSGTFDGKGHTICGLKISASAQYLGLFGYIGGDGNVKNLIVKGNVEYTGSSSSGYYTGGIAGQNDGTIENCIADVNVTGKGYCGGIAAYCNGGRIAFSANKGNITGRSNYAYSGGIAGRVNSGSIEIENVYNTGNITSNNYAGGLVGYINYVGKIENAYSAGTITCSMQYKGGCVGYGSSQFSKLKNCYFLKTDSINNELSAIKGKTDSDDVCGKTEDELKSAALVASFGGMFDADSIENPINNGFPVLKWQNVSLKYTVTVTVTPAAADFKLLQDDTVIPPAKAENGIYEYCVLRGVYKYTASKEGFYNSTGEINIDDKDVHVDVTLSEIPQKIISIDGETLTSDSSVISPGLHSITIDYRPISTNIENGLLMLAVYNSDSSLYSVLRAGDTYTLSSECNVPDGAVIKILFWKNNLEPVTIPVKISTKQTVD